LCIIGIRRNGESKMNMKIWISVWAICYIGMLVLALVHGSNSIGGFLATTLWYCGIGLPMLWCFKKADEEEK